MAGRTLHSDYSGLGVCHVKRAVGVEIAWLRKALGVRLIPLLEAGGVWP